jgi:hypothetical protein
MDIINRFCNYIYCYLKCNVPDDYKIYTINEFEKEFPFKPGDTVINENGSEGFITDLIIMRDKILYAVKYNDNQFGIVSPNLIKLKKKEMDTRNVTLTLDKAKEWYQKGGELKEIALQAFTKEELSPLPKTWEEYIRRHGISDLRCIFNGNCPQKYIALWKLEQLRDCYRQGWKPKSKECAFAIKYAERGLDVYLYSSQEFLSFQSREVAEELLKNFEPLIKEAGDLI